MVTSVSVNSIDKPVTPLNTGDIITCVYESGRVLEHVRVYWPAAWRLSDEGTVWIRGHHDAQSPEGKALLVAYVLVFG